MRSMSHNRGFQQVFKPFLEAKLNQSFPDPSKFTKDEEFLYAAKVASVFKKVIAEILQWIQEKEEAVEFYEAKKSGEVSDMSKFELGG